MKETSATIEKYYLARLNRGEEDAFDFFFNMYYRGLVVYAGQFISDMDLCEEIVQGIFIKLWKDHKYLKIESSFKSYIFRSVKNKCLDILKHHKIIKDAEQYIVENSEKHNEDTWNTYIEHELYAILMQAVKKLPEECQKIFIHSRINNYKNKEIAAKLGISVKTVENQITRALKFLRVELKDYLPFLLL